MKKNAIILILLFVVCSVFSQNKRNTYTQFDISTSLTGNPNREKETPYTHKKESWFLLDGLNANFGFGIHKNKWVAIGIHTGVNWKATQQLVAVPVFGNLKISPKLSKYDESKLFLAIGYGKTFAIGRGALSGDYKKISIGIDTNNDFSLFLELAHHDLNFNEFKTGYSFNLGISFMHF